LLAGSSRSVHGAGFGGVLALLVLLISIVFGLIPLAGIVWIFVAGSITTVDGLFMSLILLTLSGIFFFNVFCELNDRGLVPFLRKDKAASTVKVPNKTE
jgi:hypothetical protein